jgi:long-chain acyl-CoA synthetase
MDAKETPLATHPIRTLVDLLAGFSEWGDRPAIMLDREDGLEISTYRWLADSAARVAQGLIAAGVASGERVAILAPNSAAWIAAYFGIVTAGAIAVPLDYRATAGELEDMLARSDCRRLFTIEAALARLPSSWRGGDRELYLMGAAGWDTFGAARPGAAPLPRVEPDARASLLFTSGTTGTPKMVPLRHRHFAANVSALLSEHIIAGGEAMLLPLPMHHTYPFTVGMLASLASGATLVLPAGTTGPQLLHAARTARVAVLLGVPGLYRAIVAGIESRVARRGALMRMAFSRLLALSIWLQRTFRLRVGRILFARLHREFGDSLRVLGCGGAKLDPETAWKLEGLGWQVLTGYGLTETAPILTFNPPRRARLDSEGLPIPGVRLRIEPTSGTASGEIFASGPSVFDGYLDDPAANAAAFPEPGWFRTGDLGFLDRDGYLHVVGRANETLVLADGKKLFPEDVEAHYAAIPFIKEIAILLHNKVLVALIVPDPDAIRREGTSRVEALLREAIEATAATLRPHERLSGYAVAFDALPRTHLGKLKRHLLPRMYDLARSGQRQQKAAEPAAEDAAWVARSGVQPIWDWLAARYPGRRISLETSPQLDLGVDSLQWIELTIELHDRFGITLSEAAIGQILTVRDLLEEAARQQAQPAEDAAEAARDLEPLLKPAGPGYTILAMVLYGIAVLLARLMFRLKVVDKHLVPAAGPIVLTPNHSSYLDPIVLAASFKWGDLRRTCWAGWSRILLAGPVMRAISRAANVLPVDPDRDPGSALALAVSALKVKDRLVWFPEGRRSPTGRVTEFQRGIALVLERTGARAVPVYISGTFEALPRTRVFPRPRRVSVRFGNPITTDALAERGEGADRHARIASALRDAVADLEG